MNNIQVELVNKEECKEFFKKWGFFASECYATPEGREEVVFIVDIYQDQEEIILNLK